MSLKNLQLFDALNNKTYNVQVSVEDHDRALKDKMFAQSLLFHAKCTASRKHTDDGQAKMTDIVLEQLRGREHGKIAAIEDTDIEFMEPQQTGEEAYQHENVKTVYTWMYDQVTELIRSMTNHYEDLGHRKKRKHVYENIVNDLASVGYEVNTIMVQNKWKSLVKSYKNAKDNKTRTGTAPSRFHFFNAMDELLGSKPSNSCDHSINSQDFNLESSVDTNTSMTEESVINNINVPESECLGGTPMKRSEMKPVRVTEKRLKREYIQAKNEEYEKRQKRHEEKMQLEKEKIDIERRKLNLLEEYLRIESAINH